jgi:hypothetical protein
MYSNFTSYVMARVFDSVTSKKSLILFLLVSGLIFYPIGFFINSMKVNYAATFVIWVCIYLYFIYLRSSIHRILLVAITVLIPSIISGLFLLGTNMTNVIDYFADVTRFLAPFIAYCTIIVLFEKVQNKYILRLITLLFVYDLYLMFSSIVYKYLSYLNSAPFVAYHGMGLASNTTLIFVTGLLLIRNQKPFIVFLFVISFSSYILNPFIVLSKTGLVTLVTTLIVIIYVFFRHLRSIFKKFVFIILIIISIQTILSMSQDMEVFRRVKQALDSIRNTENTIDGSTSARIGEIKGVMTNLSDSWTNILFGSGNGAWISSSEVSSFYIENVGIHTGLPGQNYREGGKYIHHIHSAVFAILNRNGLLGLFFYFWFFYLLFRMGKKLLRNGYKKYRNYSIDEYFIYSYGLGIFVYLFSSFITIFPGSGMYGSLAWGSQVAVLGLVSKYLENSQNMYLTGNVKYRMA